MEILLTWFFILDLMRIRKIEKENKNEKGITLSTNNKSMNQ